MSTPIQHTVQPGDTVAYYNQRNIRRIGIVKGWRDGKVIVEHKAGYTELLHESELFILA